MDKRELDDSIDLPPLPQVKADQLQRIEAAIVAGLKPVRPLAPPAAYIAAFSGLFVAVCAVSCYAMAGQQGWDALTDLQRFLIFIPMIATVALLAFSTVRQMVPAARHSRSTATAGAGLFVLMVAIMAAVFRPIHESAFVSTGLVCFRTGMLFAIPTAFLFSLLLTRGAGLSPALTGATAGGLAGLAGLAVLEIHCPNLDLYHIFTWHISVVLLCAILGLLFSSLISRLAHVSR